MIFPDWGETPEGTSEEAVLPLFREWAVDWENSALLCETASLILSPETRR